MKGGGRRPTILCIVFTTSSRGTSVRSSRTETSIRDERSITSGSEPAQVWENVHSRASSVGDLSLSSCSVSTDKLGERRNRDT